MTRARLALFVVAGVAAAAAIIAVTGVAVARSDWFREKVRERIIAEAESATNGRVEIRVFRFDWSTLTAELDDLTIHGTEPAGVAPLFAAKRLTIGLKIISLMRRKFDIARVEAEAPKAHFIFQADGDVNIPPPRKFRLRMILDLRVGKFRANQGVILAEQAGRPPAVIPWNASGQNLAARVSYDAGKARYDGEVSLAPLHFEWDGYGPVDARVSGKVGMEKNRITVADASIETAASRLDLKNVSVDGFAAPVVSAKYAARLGLDEVDRVFRLVNFQHSGTLAVSGDARFVSLKDYLVSGLAGGAGLGYGKMHNLSASGRFAASPGKVMLSALRLKALGGDILASGEVRDFKTFQLAGQLEHFNASQLTQFAGLPALPYDGLFSGPFQARGSLSEHDFHGMVADAKVTASPAGSGVPVHGEITGKYNGTTDAIEFEPSWVALPSSRAEFSGIPGQRLQLKLHSQDLNELRAAIALPAALKSGSVDFDGVVSGPLTNPGIAGHANIGHANFEDQQIDSASGDFTASSAQVTVNDGSLAWGDSRLRVSGSAGLANWNFTDSSSLNAKVQISNGDAAKLLGLAGWKELPLTGIVSANAQFTGIAGDPRVTADFTVAKGQIYGEPYDSAAGRAQYLNSGTQLVSAVVSAGTRRMNVSGRFDRAPGALFGGKLAFDVSSNSMALNQLALLRKMQPELRGTGQIKAQGLVEISEDARGRMHVSVLDLNGDVLAATLALGTRNFGDAHLTATTRNGVLTASLVSNAVNAAIHGDGTIRLAGDYPLEGKVTFSNVKLNAVEAMLNPTGPERNENFDGAVAGEVTLSGPARQPELITATMVLSQFELRPLPAAGQSAKLQTLVLKNSGPIRMALAKSVVRVENAHFQGPDTSLDLDGSIALSQGAPLDLRLRGNINVALARTFNEDLSAAGNLAINASVRGTYDKPDFSGRAELAKGEFHYADFVNGLTNAQGVVLFNGTRATVQTFSAESGGGKVDATGFAALTGGLISFRLETRAHEVRIRYPEGVSSLSDADLTLAGTSDRSEASGRVTIRRIAINPKSDAASILASSLEPIRTVPTRTGLLANMNLDIQVETAPDVAFETSVAQSVQADASLRLRGTATNPALLGRINVTHGEAVFFGNKYTINQGSVSFFNPAKIDPVLDMDLETKARGVDVILTISGPIAKLNVSYRSDPPLQFGDIVALLATGRTPTNATLAASYTGQAQAFQQLGASALIGQALANPTPGRLQRFFGVSRIKIDPQLSGITGSPEARLTIEQQVTPDILFTYVSDVASTSTQLIRVEWDLNRQWGAILTREENGYVGLDFAYKKRFK